MPYKNCEKCGTPVATGECQKCNPDAPKKKATKVAKEKEE
jgi:hypothetical protein